jgi:hypothetical protein
LRLFRRPILDRRSAFAQRSFKYSKELKDQAIRLLKESPIPRDALPYTEEFEKLRNEFNAAQERTWDQYEFWQLLASAGKGGGAGGTEGRKRAPRTPSISSQQQLEILRLFPDGIGNRDALPYTKRFDDLHRQFGKLTGLQLDQHQFWRAVSRVAKLSRKPEAIFETAPAGGLHPDLLEFLQITNPWWRAQPLPPTERFRRWPFDEVRHRVDAGLAPVVALRGPRQVGKTTIQMQLIEHLLRIKRVPPSRIIRIQFEDVPALGSLSSPVQTIIRWYEDNVLRDSINALARRGEKVYILLDELQNVHKWSDQLKSVVDNMPAKFIVTGSSALRISHGRDSLAGRLTLIDLGPLRLAEIAGIHGMHGLLPFAPDAALEKWLAKDFWMGLLSHAKKHARQLEAAFALFSRLGGYPRCHKADVDDLNVVAQQVLDTVVVRTIEHDAIGRCPSRS